MIFPGRHQAELREGATGGKFLGAASWGLLCFLLLLLYAVFALREIDLTVADLGRHLKNGEVFLSGGTLVDTNFYSYTEPERAVVNHHWGAGALFALAWRTFGFAGLSALSVLLLLAAVSAGMVLAARIAGFPTAVCAAAAALPLITLRVAIRPEAFSYLLLALVLFVLVEHRRGFLRTRWLWLLTPVFALWVNLHIYFGFGLVLCALFLLERIMVARDPRERRETAAALAAACAATLLNPHGVAGAIVPFTIFGEYGLELTENAPLLSVQRQIPWSPVLVHYEVLLGIMGVAFVFLAVRRAGVRSQAIPAAAFLLAAALPFKVFRGLSLTAYCLIPAAAALAQALGGQFPPAVRKAVRPVAFLVVAAVVAGGYASRDFYYSPYWGARLDRVIGKLPGGGSWVGGVLRNWRRLGGIVPGCRDGAAFFQANGLAGPVLNNYDVGASLIFELFPRERVFVDNRPEAYSEAFLTRTYLPLLLHDGVWASAVQRYGFNAVFFRRSERGSDSNRFLQRRLRDPQWVPVYLDEFVVILVLHHERNAAVIGRHALPRTIERLL